MQKATPASPPPPDLGCVEWDCGNPADLDAPVALCRHHLRLAFAYVLGQVETRSADAIDTIPQLPRPPRDVTHGWVYFVQRGALIKIGWSSYPKRRFKELRPDRVLHCEPGSMADEQRTHAAFAHLREQGEWFRPEPDLLAFIDDLRRATA